MLKFHDIAQLLTIADAAPIFMQIQSSVFILTHKVDVSVELQMNCGLNFLVPHHPTTAQADQRHSHHLVALVYLSTDLLFDWLLSSLRNPVTDI